MTKHNRLYVEMVRDKMFVVRDRSLVINILNNLDAASADYICDALNTKHKAKKQQHAA